jgi:hypothetical protein
MKIIDKIFNRIKCNMCNKKFRKTKNTTCGYAKGKLFYLCPDCSIIVFERAIQGRDTFIGINSFEDKK